ncbi:hypothetical protein GGQ87_001320 [Brevundimonas alba]|uniref:Uncharacterized protein n=1 Tax=Brevundimonas alba TaxID=74314 RepID=A0A7X6BN46_9CAUL|nr:hypothetical protein [Brevundimonas alba]NJC41062.1 hypothetical protein [Brevundimonas alba]
MRKLFSLTVLAAAMATATAAQAPNAPVQRNDLCYIECQYRCYAQYPGGGPAWTQCYIACAQTKCSSGG